MFNTYFKLACTLVLMAPVVACHSIDIDFESHRDEITLFDDLYSISVIDREHAVAVGYYGAAYYTSDGGAIWKQGRTDTRASLYKVSMADRLHGWAVGQRGLVLRTVDGGANWTRQPNLKESEGTHLFAVSAIDENTAWAIGEWGTRIFTEDGGASWQDSSFTVDEQHPMFQWLSPSEQEKVRKGEKVYEDVGINDIFCRRAPSQKCWLIGEFGYIFYSEDRGRHWLRSTIEGSAEAEPIRLGYNEIEIGDEVRDRLTTFAEAIRDEGHLNVAIEGVASQKEIIDFAQERDPEDLFEILEARAMEVRTALEDAGLPSERVRMRGQPPWDYEDYLEADPDFLKRYLDGRLYEVGGVKVRVIQNPILFSVRFRDDDNGFIAGLGGVILQSNDGGRSWVYRKIDRKQALFSVGSTTGRSLAVGEKGLIRVSTDDGSSWAPPPEESFPLIFTYLRDIAFDAPGQVGFIVGQTGQILKSTDAGYMWKQVLPPTRPEADQS